jgi:hypothetical protein
VVCTKKSFTVQLARVGFTLSLTFTICDDRDKHTTYGSIKFYRKGLRAYPIGALSLAYKHSTWGLYYKKLRVSNLRENARGQCYKTFLSVIYGFSYQAIVLVRSD